MQRKHFLALADGTVFYGGSCGAPVDAVGEAVFNTGMTGYQEIVSDPSYAGQFVTLSAPGARTLRYTLDGSRPGPDSLLYQEQLKLPGAGVIRTAAEYDASEAYTGIDTSAESTLEFGVARANWSIAQCDSEEPEHPAASLLDADPDKYWLSARGALPQGVTIDTGACRTFSGAILTHPTPAVRFFSYVRRYRITGSAAAAGPFRTLLEGELDNIANNPVPQIVKFPVPAAVRWVRLEILETAPESRIPDAASLAGFELI